jgi:hypothetical protein
MLVSETDQLLLAAEHFQSWSDQLADEALGFATSFADFVRSLQGASPDQALAYLRRSSTPEFVRQRQFLIADAAIDGAPGVLDQCARLPLPHPADSEFRFDDQTAKRLACRLIDRTHDGDEILLVGTPSVALAIADLKIDRRIRFVGSDDCVTNAILSAIPASMLQIGASAGRTATIALVDPPWYSEPMRAMIATCALGLLPKSTVWIVLPAIGTKPDAIYDRIDFALFAKNCGLTQTGNNDRVGYRTPLFELAALEQQGIARLSNWRISDIHEFMLEREVDIARPQAPEAPVELTMDGVRIRLTDCSKERPTSLIPISKSEVFPSVSFRASGRRSASLWTSGNRAFNVDVKAAYSAMSAIAASHGNVLQRRLTSSKKDSPENKHVEPTNHLIHQLLELIDREKSDARRLVGDGAWLDTAKDWRF